MRPVARTSAAERRVCPQSLFDKLLDRSTERGVADLDAFATMVCAPCLTRVLSHTPAGRQANKVDSFWKIYRAIYEIGAAAGCAIDARCIC